MPVWDKRPVQFLIVLAGIVLSGLGLGGLLLAQGSIAAGRWILIADALISSAWVLYGLYCYRDRRWAKLWMAYILGSYAISFISWMIMIIGGGPKSSQAAIAITGLWVMTISFFLGLALIRFILTPGHGITAVARTVIDQAMRMKIVVIFIVGIGLIVAFLPLMYSEPRLEYRLQFFLTWSMTVTSFLLGLMTIFLACGTICGDFRDKHIHMTISKPISRFHYLVGKWTGIMFMNLLLLTVVGGGVYAFTWILEKGNAIDELDRLAVNNQVLTARRAITPLPPQGKDLHEMVNERFQQLKKEQPELYPDDEPTDKQLFDIQQKVVAKWHTIAPLNTEGYLFTGLSELRRKNADGFLELRIKPKAVKTPDDFRIRLSMRINGYYFIPSSLNPNPIEIRDETIHHVKIPIQLIDDHGNLEIWLHNLLESTSVNFAPGAGLELYYTVGGFEMNFIRSLVVLWIRLGFLGMLALAWGTFLGFPVAVLASSLMYLAAVASDFITKSVESFVPMGRDTMTLWQHAARYFDLFMEAARTGEYFNAFKVIVTIAGEGVLMIIPPFSEFDPVDLLADGLLVPNIMITDVLLQVGFVATGICLFAAWLIFRRAEVARIVV